MTRRELEALTVPALRALAGEKGLPKYQRRGRRLRKADLVTQLAEVMCQVYWAIPQADLAAQLADAMYSVYWVLPENLVEQLAEAMEPTYRVEPATKLIRVGNGAKRYPGGTKTITDVDDDGFRCKRVVRIESKTYREYEVLRIFSEDAADRFADPQNPSKTWASKYRARDAVARRELLESHARRPAPTSQPRNRWTVPSQQMLDNRGRRGGFHSNVEV